MVPAETRKGGEGLVRGGYCYRKRRQNKDNSIVWQCVHEKKGCKGKLVCLNDEVVGEVEHACEPDCAAGEVRVAVTRARRRAREDEHTPISQIFREELLEPLQHRGLEFVSKIPQFESVKKGLYSRRKKDLGVVKGKRKKEAANVPSEATSSACSQDDSSSSMPLGQPSECGPSTSGRNIEEIEIKEERVKEELILEDYGNPNDSMEFQTPEEVERIGNVKEDAREAQSSLCGTEGPFETIICGTSDVQIKQEIFEDESDAFNRPLDDEPSPVWSVPPVEGAEPQDASPTNLGSDVPSGRGYKRASKSNVKRSQKLLKAVPALSLEKCQICVNEVFSSPSDLVEHCILKHSDASSKFFPAGDPSIQEPQSAAESQGLHVPVTQSVSAATTPGFSAATTSGFSTATVPGLSVANPPGQPPHHWIPPYISACDVFDGVFVSLRNIPMGNRKATRDKILELVNFLSKSNVDPLTVNFSVTEK